MSTNDNFDFGDIKVVRNGGGSRTAVLERDVIETTTPRATSVAQPSVTHKPWLRRFWWLPLLAVAGIAAAAWGRGYYESRYVGHDYWAQVSATQDTTPVERISDNGEATGTYGVDYVVTAFNEAGEQRTLDFVARGDSAAQMPQPGAFLWLSASESIVVKQHVVPESEVPAAVREMIANHN